MASPRLLNHLWPHIISHDLPGSGDLQLNLTYMWIHIKPIPVLIRGQGISLSQPKLPADPHLVDCLPWFYINLLVWSHSESTHTSPQCACIDTDIQACVSSLSPEDCYPQRSYIVHCSQELYEKMTAIKQYNKIFFIIKYSKVCKMYNLRERLYYGLNLHTICTTGPFG